MAAKGHLAAVFVAWLRNRKLELVAENGHLVLGTRRLRTGNKMDLCDTVTNTTGAV